MSSPTDVMTKALVKHLKEKMPSVKSGIANWPAPNEVLDLPAVSVSSRSSQYSAIQPYVISKSTPEEGSYLVTVKKVIGRVVLNFQVDLWASYKPQRETLIQELIEALNLDESVMGLRVKLLNYHDQYGAFVLNSDVQIPDSEDGSQRGEWRAIATVTADCNVVQEYVAHVIGEVENTLETPNEIDEPEVSEGESII